MKIGQRRIAPLKQPLQAKEDWLTTDRRILYFLTEFVWPSSDRGRSDDGQTNSVLFDCICLAVECRSESQVAVELGAPAMYGEE